jgi:hypothetical protein
MDSHLARPVPFCILHVLVMDGASLRSDGHGIVECRLSSERLAYRLGCAALLRRFASLRSAGVRLCLAPSRTFSVPVI